MTAPARSWPDPLVELQVALAEAEAEAPPAELRGKVMEAAKRRRAGGVSSIAVERIDGAETFERTVRALDDLLASLAPEQWALPAIRGLDVQGLVGHLIGVEATFLDAVEGRADGPPAAEHVASTQAAVAAQRGRAPSETLTEWRERTSATRRVLRARDGASSPVTFYGVTLALDDLLVIRAFEMWVHDEDVRRAVGRPLAAPDGGRLARMCGLAVALLPAGAAQLDPAPAGEVRLVLTGPGGGTWDVGIGGAAGGGRSSPRTRIVVDGAEFCRVVADRRDAARAGAILDGDVTLASAVLAGAARLALD